MLSRSSDYRDSDLFRRSSTVITDLYWHELVLYGKKECAMLELITLFCDAQSEHALDNALTTDEVSVVWQIVAEMERRGHILEV